MKVTSLNSSISLINLYDLSYINMYACYEFYCRTYNFHLVLFNLFFRSRHWEFIGWY